MPKFKATSVIGDSWKITKDKIVFLVGLTLVLFVAQMLVGFILEMLKDGGYNLFFIIVQVLSSVVSVIIGMGVLWITIKIVRGESFEISDILIPLPQFFRYIGVNIVYGLIVFAGMILLIVPGIIWAIKYSQVRYLILDKKMGVLEVFSESSRLTEGSKMELFVLGILIFLINLAGALLFGVGLLFTIPLSLVALAFVYNRLLNPVGEVLATSADSVVLPPTPTTV